MGTLDGESTKQATSYDWSYAYDAQGSANAAGGMDAGSGRGSQPHAPTRIGELDESGSIVGRTFSYDANGNQLGWSDDKNATYRAISGRCPGMDKCRGRQDAGSD
ncbi:hypothetical protein [Thiohalomonas denitrificans]|uniref:hypothetical protein n=1 Tax=Thiohalomonas denitrificans TaxID=415747 RepID=UPI0026EE35A4|nr:hypothetical protein [Thiohalomonas denitrificans]